VTGQRQRKQRLRGQGVEPAYRPGHGNPGVVQRAGTKDSASHIATNGAVDRITEDARLFCGKSARRNSDIPSVQAH